MFEIPSNMIDIDEVPYQQRRFITVSRSGELRYKPDIDCNERVFRLFGKKCVKCGFGDLDCLVIDHIKGDGCIERKIMRQETLYVCIFWAFTYNITEAIDIIRDRYQVLCANCNTKKKKTNKENGDVFLQLHNSNCLNEVKRLRYIVLAVGQSKGWRI